MNLDEAIKDPSLAEKPIEDDNDEVVDMDEKSKENLEDADIDEESDEEPDSDIEDADDDEEDIVDQ